MLKTPVLHPEILSALGSAGHLSTILITDGNYPHSNRANHRAKVVWANFVPGVIDAVTALKMVCDLVPVEAVTVMQPASAGDYALPGDPPIWESFRKTLRDRSDFAGELVRLQKPEFNQQAMSSDLCLVIATAETQIWANCLVTIGVVR